MKKFLFSFLPYLLYSVLLVIQFMSVCDSVTQHPDITSSGFWIPAGKGAPLRH